MNAITLPPDLERFATEAVAAGRYSDLAAVVAAGISLLRQRDRARAEFVASVLAAEAEAEREGCLTGDEVLARVQATIARKSNAASVVGEMIGTRDDPPRGPAAV